MKALMRPVIYGTAEFAGHSLEWAETLVSSGIEPDSRGSSRVCRWQVLARRSMRMQPVCRVLSCVLD